MEDSCMPDYLQKVKDAESVLPRSLYNPLKSKNTEQPNTMFPLYQIDFYNVVKTTRYNGNRIWHITLYNITYFHYFSINMLLLYDFLFVK